MGRLLALAVLGLAALAPGCAVGRYLADRGADLGDCVRIEGGWGPGLGVQVRGAGVIDSGLAVASTPRELGFAWKYGRGHALGAGLGESGRGFDQTVDLSAAAQGLTALNLWASYETWEGLYDPTPRNPDQNEAVAYLSAAVAMPAIVAFGAMVSERGKSGRPDVITTWEAHTKRLGELHPYRADRVSGYLLPSILTWVHPDADQPRRERTRGRFASPERGGWLWSNAAMRSNRRAHVHAFDVEASVWAGFGYARAGISPGEVLDFVGGWFGWDPARDDRFARRQ